MIPWYLAFSAVLFALVMRIGGRRAANIALWVFALYPTFIYHSVVPLTQLPVAACLLLVALLILVLRGRQSLSIPAGIGAALGAAVLMRPSVVFLALGVPIFIMVRWRSVKGGLVALGVAAALVAPWLLKAKAMTGDFVFVNYATSRNLYVGNNEWTPLYKTWWFGSLERGRHGAARIRRGGRAHPGAPAGGGRAGVPRSRDRPHPVGARAVRASAP